MNSPPGIALGGLVLHFAEGMIVFGASVEHRISV
jgi:hypothetical protein